MARVLSILLLLFVSFGSTGAQTLDLIVGVTPSPPFSYDEGGEWTGLSVELWSSLADELGLEYSLQPMTLSEAVDGLADGEVDVVAAALVTSPDREERMNFSHSFYSSGLSVATSAERRSAILAFLRALVSVETLVAIAALLVLLFAVGVVVWWVERKRNPEQFGGTAAEGVGNGFWWSAVTMTTVGYGDKAPLSLPGRIVGLVWMFASIILISGFTGAIASALTVSRLAPGIESLEDLQSSRVGAIEDSTAAAFLRARGIAVRNFPDTETGLEAVAKGTIDGFVNDAPVLSHYVRQDYPEKLIVLEETFEPGFYAFGLRNGLGFEEELNRALLTHLRTPEWEDLLRRHAGQ